MVEDLSGVVEDAALRFANDLLQLHRFKLRSGNEFVEVIHIGLQVLAIVELDGLSTDNRLQRIGCVREREQRKK